MKGMKEYVAKHGRHFTEELAMAVLDNRWDPSEIEKSSEHLVYYNVSGATLGDLVFLVNSYYRDHCSCRVSKARCIKHALSIVEDVNAKGYAFSLWSLLDEEFDLTEFI